MTRTTEPTDVVLCSPLRTPVGRYGGAFATEPVQDLATTVVTAIIERTGLEAADVDDIILGQSSPNGAAPACRPSPPPRRTSLPELLS